MGDENKVSETIKAVEGVVKAVPIYQDALQPAAKELGSGALLTTAKAINLAIAPLGALVWGFDRIKIFIAERVGQKLANIPAEEIKPPPPEVAVPAIEALRYLGERPPLREMFANLLARSMHGPTSSLAHPSFVQTIQQLSCEEALLLQTMRARQLSPLATIFNVEIVGGNVGTLRETQWLAGQFQHLCAEQGIISAETAFAYYENLLRLRITEIVEKVSTQLHDEPLNVPPHVVTETRRTLQFSHYGLAFLRACMDEPGDSPEKAASA